MKAFPYISNDLRRCDTTKPFWTEGKSLVTRQPLLFERSPYSLGIPTPPVPIGRCGLLFTNVVGGPRTCSARGHGELPHPIIFQWWRLLISTLNSLYFSTAYNEFCLKLCLKSVASETWRCRRSRCRVFYPREEELITKSREKSLRKHRYVLITSPADGQ